MKKIWAVLLALLLIPTGSSYGETPPVNDGKLLVEFYDADGTFIESYSGQEAEELLKPPIDPPILEVPEVTDDIPHVHIYNENNFIIDSTDENVLKAQSKAEAAVKAASLQAYKYDPASFTHNIWIADGAYFHQPQSIEIRPKKKMNSIITRVYRQGSATPVGSVKIANFSSVANIPLHKFTKYSGNYKIQLLNEDPNQPTIYLDTAHLYYK
ncbi:hypothetical protein JOC94_000375 [Bacillus thermophilus]|uniref:Uncharacterized protein n=1 Tax=Siminovitchia thermophila TaxID=1245522 RepID=A0ABS2R193_9BACI|nr:hypothetical protein [Siminovitchia thermophila]MBM7713407.1 hypothetical protein [Siminovitchia thermophila]